MSVERIVGAVLVGAFFWMRSRNRPVVSAEFQGFFERFHDAIKLEENDGRRKLREKRDVILATLERGLPYIRCPSKRSTKAVTQCELAWYLRMGTTTSMSD